MKGNNCLGVGPNKLWLSPLVRFYCSPIRIGNCHHLLPHSGDRIWASFDEECTQKRSPGEPTDRVEPCISDPPGEVHDLSHSSQMWLPNALLWRVAHIRQVLRPVQVWGASALQLCHRKDRRVGRRRMIVDALSAQISPIMTMVIYIILIKIVNCSVEFQFKSNTQSISDRSLIRQRTHVDIINLICRVCLHWGTGKLFCCLSLAATSWHLKCVLSTCVGRTSQLSIKSKVAAYRRKPPKN